MRRLWLELGVLAALLASFATVPLPLPHVLIATVWVALTTVHVVRRRRIYVALLRSGRRRRAAATTVLIASAVVATLSGFAQWAGVAAAIPWHAGSSTLLVAFAVAHGVRRVWRHYAARHGRSPDRVMKTSSRISLVSRGSSLPGTARPGGL